MEKFEAVRGRAIPLNRADVDTDQIIPAQYLKRIERTGFGQFAFEQWRKDPGFVTNNPAYAGAPILLAGPNFGCGSSREHAVWAITQYGIKAIIAPRVGEVPAFADIFHNNSVKNGLLNVELKAAEVEEIFQMVERYEGLEATVNLDEQRVTLHLPEEISFHFEIDPAVKNHLIRGLDEIGLTLQREKEIGDFEKNYKAQVYW